MQKKKKKKTKIWQTKDLCTSIVKKYCKEIT